MTAVAAALVPSPHMPSAVTWTAFWMAMTMAVLRPGSGARVVPLDTTGALGRAGAALVHMGNSCKTTFSSVLLIGCATVACNR